MLNVDAVILDMDGVISDTQRLHSEVESELLAAWGVRMDADEITRRFAGTADHDFFPAAFGRPLQPGEYDRLVEQKWEMMDARTPGRIVAMEGALELIALLRERAVPLAVASGSPMPFIDRVLAELGIGAAFAARASASEVPHGKPAPDVFLLAAERLGVAPGRCVVIEDAIAGMTAARRAGMRVIALVADPAAALPADAAVRSLREIVAQPERFLMIDGAGATPDRP